jgi:tetratricopeptide (TPR) repeat protein
MLGSVYQCLELLEEAENFFRQALALDPERATTLNNLSVALLARGQLDEAITVLRHLVETQPGYAEGHWNLSVALLAASYYKDGWQEFEWRFKKVNPVPEHRLEPPRWDGSPLNGRTILLHAEQGFGDTIQFARYVPLVVRLGGTVIIECQVPALKRLLFSLDGIADVVVAGDPLPSFDCHHSVTGALSCR